MYNIKDSQFYLLEKQASYKLIKYDNLQKLIIVLNNKLTKLYKDDSYKSYFMYSSKFNEFIHKNTIIISWETLNYNIALGYFPNNNLMVSTENINIFDIKNVIDDIKLHLIYFIFPKNLLKSKRYSKYINNLHRKDIWLTIDTNLLIELMTKKYLTDPYILFYKILKKDESELYQSFINYLNKTLKRTNRRNNLDLEMIKNNFFINGNVNNMHKYTDLILHYFDKIDINILNYKYIMPNRFI